MVILPPIGKETTVEVKPKVIKPVFNWNGTWSAGAAKVKVGVAEMTPPNAGVACVAVPAVVWALSVEVATLNFAAIWGTPIVTEPMLKVRV